MAAMAHSPARALDVGSVIAGTYTIEGLLGKGGMGAVFVASHARLPGKKVAVKVLHPDVADGDSMARFRREAEIASRLGHANIVEVHDWNQLPDGTPYIVYELLQGEALNDRLRRGPMSLDEASGVIRQVGSALAAAHREHIVHRDLKPQNIFLVAADDGISVKAKVLDFGISKIRGSTTVKTQDTAMLGTPQYMAPEQAMGQQDQIDQRTDVFAFGAVVYEMLAGVPAFQGATIPEVVFKVVYEETPDLSAKAPGLPPHVVAAVHKALAKKSDDRWPDVGTFVEALTGSPLASGKRNIVTLGGGGGGAAATGAGTGPGSVKSTGQDAFAATMGSGDHASAMAASTRASIAAAQTVAGTAQSGNAPSPVVEKPKSKLPLVLGLAAVVAAAVVAVIVITGGGGG
jgi:eukaryotic-like serine/threonine-protein kinase